MKPFTIDKNDAKMQSINRTIRIKPEHYEKITQLSEETGVSFNKIITQCISYALENMDSKNIILNASNYLHKSKKNFLT